MDNKNNILLISDDENFSKVLKSKLIFLRDNDFILLSDYQDAVNTFELSNPEIVLVHENQSADVTFDLIKKLRINKNLCIVLIANAYNKDVILTAYDLGIDDFVISSDDDFEFVIRIVNNIKHNSVKIAALRNSKILEQLNVIDDLTGLYNYAYAKQAIENEIDDNLIDDGYFVVLGPSDESKNIFSSEKMAKAIKASIRYSDIAVLGKGAKFYLLLPKTSLNGAITVINKIEENYGNEFKLCAGICSIAHKTFEEMEASALQAVSEASSTGVQYIAAEEKGDSLADWLGDEYEHPKNYKLFRQIFNTKMEKVITPVFYRLQKAWEEKLFETEIEQYTGSEQCVFHLKNKNRNSTLRIVYPGFAKIMIYIVHDGLDSPENKEIQLSLTKISQKELINIVEDFIKEFKYTCV